MRPLLLLLSLLLASCAGLPRGWAEAQRTAPADALSGAWQGTWKSDTNGHSGSLHAVAAPARAGVWEFRFRAAWAGIFSAPFVCEVSAQSDRRRGWTFTGGKDLGSVFGGVFTCHGAVRSDTFTARYEAHGDRGLMEMRRVRR